MGTAKASEILKLMKLLEHDWKLKVSNPKNWATYLRIIKHSAKWN
jgi:hypothetical protein